MIAAVNGTEQRYPDMLLKGLLLDAVPRRSRSPLLRSTLCTRSLTFFQERFNVFSESDLHVGLGLPKTTRVNSNRGLLAGAAPAVIPEPEFAFDAQTRSHFERHCMICHDLPPLNNRSRPQTHADRAKEGQSN